MDALTIRDVIIDALAHLDVDVTDGEPETGADGRLRRTVIVGVTTSVAGNRRAAGGSVDRACGVNLLIVTASRDSCLWLTGKVQDAITDYPIARGARLTDASYDGEPVPEPSTRPEQWSRALTYNVTTKRSTR